MRELNALHIQHVSGGYLEIDGLRYIVPQTGIPLNAFYFMESAAQALIDGESPKEVLEFLQAYQVDVYFDKYQSNFEQAVVVKA